jgi:hypothetical protein
MSDFLKVSCPDCKTILIVRRRDGEVVEVRRPLLDESTGDRFQDAELKVKREKETIARKFEEAKKREQNKFERLNALFDENMKKAREEGPVKKVNPLEGDPFEG